MSMGDGIVLYRIMEKEKIRLLLMMSEMKDDGGWCWVVRLRVDEEDRRMGGRCRFLFGRLQDGGGRRSLFRRGFLRDDFEGNR